MQKVVNIFSWNFDNRYALIHETCDYSVEWSCGYRNFLTCLSQWSSSSVYSTIPSHGFISEADTCSDRTTTLCLTFTRYSPSSRSEVFNRFLSRWGCDNFDPPGRVRSIAMSVCVCLSSVCLSVCYVGLHRPNLNSRHTSFSCPKFTKFSVHVACGLARSSSGSFATH